MDALDQVLPVYVDYLGRYEEEPGYIASPQDVMRDLLARGVTDKRFVPNGELSISDGVIILRDTIQRTIAERFILRNLRTPVAFIAQEQDRHSKSGFSRVVILTEDGAGHFDGNPIYHAFQCLESNPEDVVEMVTAAINKNTQPPAAARMASRNSLDNNWMINSDDLNSRRGPVPATVPLVTSDTDKALFLDQPRRQYENTDNLIEKYTILLNFCIEDIETFCADCKAAKQQQRGLGEMQANDFVRVFQKFKLAFNLLAHLQGHINNPDAPTLLHHMFPPLAFLVDECYDLFGDDLVKDVISPLPTRRAVRMLTASLNEREQVIWKALGDYWRQPRANWDGDIPVYRPMFHGGWSPGVIHLPDDGDLPEGAAFRRIGSDRSKKTSSISSNDDVFGRNSYHRANFDDFRDELMAKKARIALVTFDRMRTNSKELTVRKGEYLHVLDDERKWWKCKTSEGEVGFVPHTILKAIIYTDTFDDFEERKKYEHIKRASTKHRRGRSASPTSSEDSEVAKRSSSPTPSIPPPAPPLPKPVVQKKPEIARRPNSYNASVRSTDSMQQELSAVLAMYRENQKLDIQVTPEVYITQTSTPHEVKNWLVAKKFSQRVLKQMAGMHGGDLFAMSRKDLIAAFGNTEGRRLDSQITISRNTAGFKTARSSELKKILEKARKRSEKEKEERELEDVQDDMDEHDEYSRA